MKNMFKRLVPRQIQIHRIENHERNQLNAGTPENLSLDLLQEVCNAVFNTAIKDVSYIHLSGWKQAGAYRLFLKLETNAKYTLVYKEARYVHDEIPALQDLPVRPGLPEYIVYRLRDDSIREYLPTVYWSDEQQSEKTYRYLCEDLGVEYYLLSRSARAKRDILVVAEQLPLIHRALDKSLESNDKEQMLRYDREYSEAIINYARDSIKMYEEKTSDSVARSALDRWSELEQIYLRDEYFKERPNVLMHGDFNTSNIYIKKNGNGLKVVDWEWAGTGIPHSDLVSLVKGLKWQTKKAALERFARQFDRLSASEHEKWFIWSSLSRGLLESAFLARQQLESKRLVGWIPERIRNRLKEVLEASRDLA